MVPFVTTQKAHHDGITIAYEMFGDPGGAPLLLVMGLGVQMLYWPDGFCQALAERGFAVVRFDNRDVGLSTHLTNARPPHPLRQLLFPRTPVPYRLTDLADDAQCVLDALGWRAAHLVGVSMGGMITQILAMSHPERVLSLVSISSRSTMRSGLPSFGVSRALRAPAPGCREEAGDRELAVTRVIGSPGFPRDDQWARRTAMLAYDRGEDAAGVRRQLAAMLACDDLRPGLARVRVPALVLHGEADPLAPLSCARATAAAIPGARLVTIPGWGHDLPPQLWPRIVNEIATTTGQ
jgi:pimeloyl-ACP methyl ester carboxylesterase